MWLPPRTPVSESWFHFLLPYVFNLAGKPVGGGGYYYSRFGSDVHIAW